MQSPYFAALSGLNEALAARDELHARVEQLGASLGLVTR